MMGTFKRSKDFGTVWNQVAGSKWTSPCSGNKSQWLRKTKVYLLLADWSSSTYNIAHPVHLHFTVVSKVAASRIGRDGRNQLVLTCLITSYLPEPSESHGPKLTARVAWKMQESTQNTVCAEHQLSLLKHDYNFPVSFYSYCNECMLDQTAVSVIR